MTAEERAEALQAHTECWNRANSNYSYSTRVPEAIWEGLERYAKHHCPVGSFLQAALENNLYEAIGRADRHSLAAIVEIVIAIRWCLPSESHGSKEKYQAWVAPEWRGQ